MSTKTTILMVAAVASAGALFATKPGPAAIEEKIAEMIVGDIQTTGSSDLASGILLMTCKANINDCAKLLRTTMDVQSEDKILWQKVTISQGEKSLSCLGILNQLRCN
ncbi:hypothetical protein PEL8287_03127 [Roseovarius litorisediminis]|uniref:Uncharacterized protein n=1 Tax=Roseovarius litorisediminis TaxID=1312363 RepID=A0A1Y5TDK1_9RHOB|nr:hypothetical protein [Roseovarius litorisediminis]SLN57950.1 hypothetical protein PEL8287_03127 [Roseovarius litorisediminis]